MMYLLLLAFFCLPFLLNAGQTDESSRLTNNTTIMREQPLGRSKERQRAPKNPRFADPLARFTGSFRVEIIKNASQPGEGTLFGQANDPVGSIQALREKREQQRIKREKERIKREEELKKRAELWRMEQEASATLLSLSDEESDDQEEQLPTSATLCRQQSLHDLRAVGFVVSGGIRGCSTASSETGPCAEAPF